MIRFAIYSWNVVFTNFFNFWFSFFIQNYVLCLSQGLPAKCSILHVWQGSICASDWYSRYIQKLYVANCQCWNQSKYYRFRTDEIGNKIFCSATNFTMLSKILLWKLSSLITFTCQKRALTFAHDFTWLGNWTNNVTKWQIML